MVQILGDRRNPRHCISARSSDENRRQHRLWGELRQRNVHGFPESLRKRLHNARVWLHANRLNEEFKLLVSDAVRVMTERREQKPQLVVRAGNVMRLKVLGEITQEDKPVRVFQFLEDGWTLNEETTPTTTITEQLDNMNPDGIL